MNNKNHPHRYRDFAIVLSWPETTARGDHKWCDVLQKVGVLKNKNFRVGHAAIILINTADGSLHYYDFGRYVTPRGYGRARSASTDPKLSFEVSAHTQNSSLDQWRDPAEYIEEVVKTPDFMSTPVYNLVDIILELESKKRYTHGNGPVFFSVADSIDFGLANQRAESFVQKGSMKYSAFMPGNSNCSRFVESVLLAGLKSTTRQRKNLIIHETIISSPISNVVNASYDGMVYQYNGEKFFGQTMNRKQSLRFFMDKTLANFKKDSTVDLPDDTEPGCTHEPERPVTLPSDVQWLGGIGEGAWYRIEKTKGHFSLLRYDMSGEIEFARSFTSTWFNPDKPYRITYDTHALKLTVIQDGQVREIELKNSINSSRAIADPSQTMNSTKSNPQSSNALQYS